MTILRFRIFNSRRAATPPAAPERQCPTPPREGAAASPSCEVVRLEDRRLPGAFPWCPVPPYVGAFILGAALASATTVYVAADISTIPARMWASAFAIWSA
ncbi:hypothetical protein [Xanthobacter autotrophicus]|uniref:hypothetical protein n=1 Tax=Xanthobacter autotrophicus TaxID=280 RepID=UPI00372ABCC9